ncbi:hypothetical protein GY45DRAFT_996960 [Cubamyces sp. BRFM 1775]|nr:hypothetical protein GY45DRAFT_996960 [Cubamyces sp. BRFM 1775]
MVIAVERAARCRRVKENLGGTDGRIQLATAAHDRAASVQGAGRSRERLLERAVSVSEAESESEAGRRRVCPRPAAGGVHAYVCVWPGCVFSFWFSGARAM